MLFHAVRTNSLIYTVHFAVSDKVMLAAVSADIDKFFHFVNFNQPIVHQSILPCSVWCTVFRFFERSFFRLFEMLRNFFRFSLVSCFLEFIVPTQLSLMGVWLEVPTSLLVLVGTLISRKGWRSFSLSLRRLLDKNISRSIYQSRRNGFNQNKRRCLLPTTLKNFWILEDFAFVCPWRNNICGWSGTGIYGQYNYIMA